MFISRKNSKLKNRNFPHSCAVFACLFLHDCHLARIKDRGNGGGRVGFPDFMMLHNDNYNFKTKITFYTYLCASSKVSFKNW